MRFDLSFVVSLDRRADRLERFREEWNRESPNAIFGEPERIQAIDGKLCSSPSWFTAGCGAWGCYRSHLSAIERALNTGAESLAMFEDDATLAHGFAEKATRFFERLPEKWEIAYLGGQHLRPPQRIDELTLRAHNVNRTHAYCIKGKETLHKLYRHLTRTNWKSGHHIDHHFGQFHQTGRAKVFAPARWIVGQAEGKSNINAKEKHALWWQPSRVIENEKPIVAILGAFRGGTSATAGALHNLGVSMGKQFAPPKPANPKGFFEAKQLAELCRRAYREPWMKRRGSSTSSEIVRRLHDWQY